MKLSEAMRIGATLRPQCSDQFYLAVGNEIHSCAMGAAFEGAGFYKPEELDMPCYLDDKAHLFDGIAADWSFGDIAFKCPAECGQSHPVPALATHLNDWHGWTREQIADHIETLGY